jgi:hypothetical protein
MSGSQWVSRIASFVLQCAVSTATKTPTRSGAMGKLERAVLRRLAAEDA